MTLSRKPMKLQQQQNRHKTHKKKQKVKQNALEYAEISLDKEIIEVEKKVNTELKKVTDEATSKQKKLLVEQTTAIELTKELAELKVNIKNNTTNSAT